MKRFPEPIILMLSLAMAAVAHAQKRPYVGYAYPAGGRQGSTFEIKLGGQDLDFVNGAVVTGTGVAAKVTRFYRRIGNQEVQLLNEQLKILKSAETNSPAAEPAMMAAEPPPMMESNNPPAATPAAGDLIGKIQHRLQEAVSTPACASLASLVWLEVTIAADAPPGPRELRLVTPRGVSNPLVVHVGTLPESTRKAMISASLQVLGKEASARRKRPPEEIDVTVALPCTVNGQIASGEVNRYRFHAAKGQRLVMSTQARQLIPYIADAVPGWFQPVLALYNSKGREVAYQDDHWFKPDPVILFEVPADDDYVLEIHDSLYRGREDFVYRITIGELPYVTSIFPMGGNANAPAPPRMLGWGLHHAKLDIPAEPHDGGLVWLAATCPSGRSNAMPYRLDTLPELSEKESNNHTALAQKITLPIIINGRIGTPDDWDVYQFKARANDEVVIEVHARQLDSPLDSIIKLTDSTGKVLAFNDDSEDLTAGTNTHHADSYLMTRLPADGNYFVHIGDTARHSGDAHGYRLRISAPRPGFELRVVPSSLAIPVRAGATATVYAIRKDGFTGPIQLTLQNPPDGISAAPATIPAGQPMVKFYLKATRNSPDGPCPLILSGNANTSFGPLTRVAVPAEDRMQAFLWRHLVPATQWLATVTDPRSVPNPKRIAPTLPNPPKDKQPPGANTPANTPPVQKFTKQQIEGRLRQLKFLYEEGWLTDSFYLEKVAACHDALL